MFESSSGIESNRAVQLALALVLAIAAVCFALSTRKSVHLQSQVSGVYRNACCADVSIREGRLVYGGQSEPVRLERMKFGLAGYVRGTFTPDSISQSPELTTILFGETGSWRNLVIPVERRDVIFLRDGHG